MICTPLTVIVMPSSTHAPNVYASVVGTVRYPLHRTKKLSFGTSGGNGEPVPQSNEMSGSTRVIEGASFKKSTAFL